MLALAGICPFVGSLSDLLGRRYVAILGAVLVCLGLIVSSTANTMNTFIGGMAISGAGAGLLFLALDLMNSILIVKTKQASTN